MIWTIASRLRNQTIEVAKPWTRQAIVSSTSLAKVAEPLTLSIFPARSGAALPKMRRVDITLGQFARDCTISTRYSFKGLWQKSWFLQIYLCLIYPYKNECFDFYLILGDLGNPWKPLECSKFSTGVPAPGDQRRQARANRWDCLEFQIRLSQMFTDRFFFP